MKKMIASIKSLCFFMVLPCVFLSVGCGAESDYLLESAEFSQSDAAQSARPPKCAQDELCLLGLTTAIFNYNLAVHGHYMYGSAFCSEESYTHGLHGLQIIDISNPVKPEKMGCVDIHPGHGSESISVGPNGNYAYIGAGGTQGGYVVDVSQKKHPVLVGEFPDDFGGIEYVEVKGHTAFILGHDNFIVADVSDPSQPEMIWSYQVPGGARQLIVAKGYVYLAGQHLYIFDVSNPAAPWLAGQVEHSSLDGIQVAGNYAYGIGSNGLTIFDISQPEVAFPVSSVAEGFHSFGDLAINQTHIYVTVHPTGSVVGGVRVFNISNPLVPSLATSVDIAGGCDGVELFGGNKVAFNCGGFGHDFEGAMIYKTLK